MNETIVKTREGGMIMRRGEFNVGRNRMMETDGDQLTLRGSPEGDQRESEWLKEPGTRGGWRGNQLTPPHWGSQFVRT